MVKFTYDPEKCVLPHDPDHLRPTVCLKCLDACPRSLIMFRPLREKGPNGAPVRYEIHMAFKSQADKYCPGCLKCVEVCPEKAIQIK
ncbi:MAG: 4Fe-4S dicluster domain-containing protein [Candidatus Jordarchaeales archaeon]|nr:4Fe-4S dicluster domain-containing protein [Candidatus Jordarchaeia archaeon]